MGKHTSALAASNAKKELIWRDRFARHTVSKQNIEEFCRSESVSSGLFYQWRKRLGIKAINPTSAPRTSSTTFLDLGAVSAVVPAAERQMIPDAALPQRGIELRIDLGGDMVLTIVRR